MLNKRFVTSVALLALAAMASAVSAGQVVLRKAEPAKFPKRVDLRLSFGPVTLVGAGLHGQSHAEWATELQVRNPTGETIQRGTTIYWSVYHHIGSPTPASTVEIKGSFLLERDLAPGDVVKKGVALMPAYARAVQPKLTPKGAWCFLRADPKPPPLPSQQNPAARPNLPKLELVYLTAGMIGVELVVANNTGSPIPQGTRIYWSVKGKCSPDPAAPQCEKKGSFDSGLGNTGQKFIYVYGVYPLYVAQAWFYK